jgi:hypothetical protein
MIIIVEHQLQEQEEFIIIIIIIIEHELQVQEKFCNHYHRQLPFLFCMDFLLVHVMFMYNFGFIFRCLRVHNKQCLGIAMRCKNCWRKC